MRAIRAIHLHHSAGSELDTPEYVARAAVDRGIGITHDPYHFHIWRRSDGGSLGEDRWCVSPGRAIEEDPASSAGNNAGAVAVCVHGRWDGRPLPRWALGRLVGLLVELCRRYGLGVADIHGHRELPGAATLCPGYDPGMVRAEVAAAMGVA